MGRKEDVLHRAGGRADFVEGGYLAIEFDPGGNGDDNRRPLATGAKLVALFRASFIGPGNLVVNGHQCLPENRAGVSTKYMETPWLGPPVGRRPVCILQYLKEKAAIYLTAAIHHVRLDGAACPIREIDRHMGGRFRVFALRFK